MSQQIKLILKRLLPQGEGWAEGGFKPVIIAIYVKVKKSNIFLNNIRHPK